MDSQHKAAGPIEFAAPASRIMDAKRRALILAEEGYYLTSQPSQATRWQHPLQRSIQTNQGK
jgi:hypothetical protein